MRFTTFLVVFSIVLGSARELRSELVRFEIHHREAYDKGRAYGEVGPYERIQATAYFAVDPRSAANQNIVDLPLAAMNKMGQVEFSADVEILAPVDMSKSNGAVFYDVNNRGRPTCLGIIAGGDPDFFFRHGFVVVWSGWIAELLPENRSLLRAPVATQDGKPILGIVRAEMVPDSAAARLSIAHWDGHGSYEPTERGIREATLTWRRRERDDRVAIPREQWQFDIHRDNSASRGQLPLVEVVLSGGFRPGFIYELVYEASGPIVQGLGLAGIRDLISCFKYAEDDRNPLRLKNGHTAVQYAYGFGTSQSGRCLRMFLYDGFNADEQTRIVFDGVIPHVAGAGLGFFNHRFASPTRHNSQHDNHLYPADVFPFTYGDEQDPFTDRVDGILRRCRESNTVPKVFHTQSSSEYWHRSGSLVHTDPLGQHDTEIPAGVRVYTFGGTQHGPGSGQPQSASRGQLPSNPADYRPFMRALVMAMDAWVRDGVEPPPSVYPRIDRGDLVGWREADSGWHALPGVRYPEVIQQPDFVDRGPEYLSKRITTVEPPLRLNQYVVKVPGYRPDNSERGCLDLPDIAVPVATYTSWNLRSPSIGADDELLSLSGGYVPLLRTEAERRAAGDPRPALLERYRDFSDYLQQYRAALHALVDARYVLPDDVAKMENLARSREPSFNPSP